MNEVAEYLSKRYDDNIKKAQQRLKPSIDNSSFSKSHNKYAAEQLKKDPMSKAQTKDLSPENIGEMWNDSNAFDDILYMIAAKIFKTASPEELRLLGVNDTGEYNIENIAEAMKQALGDREKETWPEEMPEYLYRGIGGELLKESEWKDPEQHGFEGVKPREVINGDDRPTVFITSAPSVAASYGRRDKFDRIGYQPTSHGDSVYRIITKGLDPKLFMRDKSSDTVEALYGPQYMYKGSIPQEDIDMTDSAGNLRKIKRIEKQAYLSDELFKDVYIQKHLIDGVSRRF